MRYVLALVALLALAVVATSNGSPPKPLSLSTATKAACNRVPARLKARYAIAYERITPELANSMRGYAGRFACGFRPVEQSPGSRFRTT